MRVLPGRLLRLPRRGRPAECGSCAWVARARPARQLV